MHKKNHILLIGFLMVAVPTLSFAATPGKFTAPKSPRPLPTYKHSVTTNNPANALNVRLKRIHTMRANFVQMSYTRKNGKVVIQRQNGYMTLKRPGKFRWEVVNPNRQTLVANNSKLWFYDGDLNQVTKKTLSAGEIGSPAMLLISNLDNLTKNFVVTKIGVGSLFHLKPKSANSLYQGVQLYFVRNQLQGMQIIDNLGQKTTITFSNILQNRPVLPATFLFVPPVGADVIEA